MAAPPHPPQWFFASSIHTSSFVINVRPAHIDAVVVAVLLLPDIALLAIRLHHQVSWRYHSPSNVRLTRASPRTFHYFLSTAAISVFLLSSFNHWTIDSNNRPNSCPNKMFPRVSFYRPLLSRVHALLPFDSFDNSLHLLQPPCLASSVPYCCTPIFLLKGNSYRSGRIFCRQVSQCVDLLSAFHLFSLPTAMVLLCHDKASFCFVQPRTCPAPVLPGHSRLRSKFVPYPTVLLSPF